MKKIILILLLGFIGTINAAKSFDYLDARNGKMLQVPSDLNESKVSKYFVIESTSVQPGKTPVPPGSALEKHLEANPMAAPGLPSESISHQEINQEPVLWVNQTSNNVGSSILVGLAKQEISRVKNTGGKILIYDSFTTYDRVRDDTPIYWVKYNADKNASVIRIRDESGARINPNTARRLLANISEGMRGIHSKEGFLDFIRSKNSTHKYG